MNILTLFVLFISIGIAGVFQIKRLRKRYGAAVVTLPSSLAGSLQVFGPVLQLAAWVERMAAHIRWGLVAEVAVLCLWGIWIGRSYLNSNPTRWPAGGDFPLTVQSLFAWEQIATCGACMLWDGSMNGGVPTFVDLHGAILHPLVILTTLAAGVINGSKIVLVVSLIVAGIAQWWLAYTMNIGRIPRLWGALMATAGGHVSGRMELGLIGMVLSISATCLLLAPSINLALYGRRRTALVLGVLLALALLAGQGYMQLAILLCLAPALLVLLVDESLRLRATWKGFVHAGVLAVLLTGVLWVPVLHFLPNLTKNNFTNFEGVQPLAYAPLNLVIADRSYYRSDVLEKVSIGGFTINYIGWVPIMLALLALYRTPPAKRRLHTFCVVAIALVFLTSSATTLRLLGWFIPSFVEAIRYPSLIAPLAVPFVLALAASALDDLLKRGWPTVTISFSPQITRQFRLSLLLLGVLLVISLKSVSDFSATLLITESQPKEFIALAGAMRQSGATWIKPPVSIPFETVALEHGLRLTNSYRAWGWGEREEPPPSLETVDTFGDVPMNNRLQVGEFLLVYNPDAAYAFMETASGRRVCDAQAKGGNIDVICESDTPGTLVVHETSWSGWQVWRNDTRAQLGDGPWLSVDAPAGLHHYAFRYRPWDVPLGIFVTLCGVVYAIWMATRIPGGDCAIV